MPVKKFSRQETQTEHQSTHHEDDDKNDNSNYYKVVKVPVFSV